MAVCLGCGSNRAVVVSSRSAVVLENEGACVVIERVCRRLTRCNACGEHRMQTIRDDGITRRRRIEDGWNQPSRRYTA